MKVALVVLMVVLIHAIEAYILNPFIYSGCRTTSFCLSSIVPWE